VAIFVLPTAWMAASVFSPAIERVSQWADLSVTTAPLTAGAMTAADWGPLAVSVGIWVLLPLVVGGWRLQRREVV
jgi:ABC-2 type transport system permease protein